MNQMEMIAAATAHRACCGIEHDPSKGKLHGYCVVCGVPWPCETASRFIVQPQQDKETAVQNITQAKAAEALPEGEIFRSLKMALVALKENDPAQASLFIGEAIEKLPLA